MYVNIFNSLRALVLSPRLPCLLGHDDHETLESSTLANDARDEPLLTRLCICGIYVCILTYIEYEVSLSTGNMDV